VKSKLRLGDIFYFHKLKFDNIIDDIITDFKTLLSRFYLDSTKCKKINKETFDKYLKEYKKCENNTKITIKKINCFKQTFATAFLNLLEECYNKEKDIKYYYYKETRTKNKELIFAIINKYINLIKNLSLFYFFLNEIVVIFRKLNINIDFLSSFINKINYHNLKELDELFLKYIFKENISSSLLEYLYSIFGKDDRDLDLLLRFFY